jgi:hypothetical protein
LFLLSNENTFDKVRGTNKRGKNTSNEVKKTLNTKCFALKMA